MELEALESLFPVEMRKESETSFSLVGLVPFADNSKHNYVSVDLSFSIPADYPLTSSINWTIAKTTGCIATDSSRLEDLEAAIRAVCSENAGCSVVYQIAERVQEWLRENNEEEKSLHDMLQSKPVVSKPPRRKAEDSDDEDDSDYSDDEEYDLDDDDDDESYASEEPEYEGLQMKVLCAEEERVKRDEFLAWKLEYDQLLLKSGLIKRIAPGDTRQTGKQQFLQALMNRKDKREDGQKIVDGDVLEDFNADLFGGEDDVEFDDDEEVVA